jgi:hypothetical protein
MKSGTLTYEEESDDESVMDEVEAEAKARRCSRCSRLVRGLRALYGKLYCSALCAHGGRA